MRRKHIRLSNSQKGGCCLLITIKDLKGNVIYSELELRPQIYYVDKQNIMMD
jgi:hypothetical protein